MANHLERPEWLHMKCRDHSQAPIGKAAYRHRFGNPRHLQKEQTTTPARDRQRLAGWILKRELHYKAVPGSNRGRRDSEGQSWRRRRSDGLFTARDEHENRDQETNSAHLSRIPQTMARSHRRHLTD